MIVSELIRHLQQYEAAAPENGQAEVLLQSFDEMYYGLAGANDARGMMGQHALIFVPDLKQALRAREFKLQ